MRVRLPEALLCSQSDERLAALAGRGSERAFDALVERYRKPLLGFARATTGPELAEDVVQQALTQAWAALRQGAEVRHVRGWLYQIVRHTSWKASAQTNVSRELDPDLVAVDSLHLAVESRFELRELVDNITQLPEHQRLALVQTAVEGRSRSEIADTLGVTEGAVRQLVHRARERLRKAAAGLIPLPVLSWLTRGERRASFLGRGRDVMETTLVSPHAAEGVSKAVVGLVAAAVVAVGAGSEAVRPAAEASGPSARGVAMHTNPVAGAPTVNGAPDANGALRGSGSARLRDHRQATTRPSRTAGASGRRDGRRAGNAEGAPLPVAAAPSGVPGAAGSADPAPSASASPERTDAGPGATSEAKADGRGAGSDAGSGAESSGDSSDTSDSAGTPGGLDGHDAGADTSSSSSSDSSGAPGVDGGSTTADVAEDDPASDPSPGGG